MTIIPDGMRARPARAAVENTTSWLLPGQRQMRRVGRLCGEGRPLARLSRIACNAQGCRSAAPLQTGSVSQVSDPARLPIVLSGNGT